MGVGVGVVDGGRTKIQDAHRDVDACLTARRHRTSDRTRCIPLAATC